MVITWLWLMISWPGWVSNGTIVNANDYLTGTFIKLDHIQIYAWLSFSLVSTLITVVSIIKIFKTTSQLSNNNYNVKTNNNTMILHLSLLIIQFLGIAASSLTISLKIGILLTILDLFVQLAICYICWTLGSST